MTSDFKELEDFIEKFTINENEIVSLMEGFLEEKAQRVVAGAKERTPTISGELRRAWQVGDVSVNGKDVEVEILNGMEYATFVEFGATNRDGTWRDGQYILTISINEMQKQIPLRWQKTFAEFLKSKGVG